MKKTIRMIICCIVLIAGCETIENVTPEDIQAVSSRVEHVQGEVDKVQGQVASVTEAVKDTQYTCTGITALIEATKQANKATAPFNPYSTFIDLGLGLALAIVGLFAKKKTTEAAQYALKYEAHKVALESERQKLLVSESANIRAIAGQLYDAVGEARARLGVT
jgi:uncharacterized protein (UPF0335 family)